MPDDVETTYYLDSKGWAKRAAEGQFIPGDTRVLLNEIAQLQAEVQTLRTHLRSLIADHQEGTPDA